MFLSERTAPTLHKKCACRCGALPYLLKIHPAGAKVLYSFSAEKVNQRLRERGESGISEKKLGIVLTSLNLTHRYRASGGYMLSLNRAIKEEIHSLAKRHSLKSVNSVQLSVRCVFCRFENPIPLIVGTKKEPPVAVAQ